MFSEKIQYNAPIPGEEFKQRDLSIPAEATKVVFEIDSQHGEDKSLCVAILQRTFRGTETISKILHDCSQKVSTENHGDNAWRFQAEINRSVRNFELEMTVVSLKTQLQDLQTDHRAIAKELGNFPSFPNQTPTTPRANLTEQFQQEGEQVEEVLASPQQYGEPSARQQELAVNQAMQQKITFELTAAVREMAFYKADSKNERFAANEIKAAKDVTGPEMVGDPRAEWNDCLLKILTAILKLPS